MNHRPSTTRIRCWAWLLLLVGQASFAANTTVHYTVSTDDFTNPERGFYKHFETFASSHVAMPDWAENFRLNGVADHHNTYSVQPTLILRLFYLDSFISTNISPAYLEAIATDFDKLREMGFKAIVRFAYTKDEVRPFDEPSKQQILDHIAQLKPILHTHRDVIAVVQQGLIGAYGEGYYTDIFSVAGSRWTDANWIDRADILRATLDAVPRERMVQVRYPQQKQKYFHGPDAPISTSAMTLAQAHTESAIARVGLHNDCLVSSFTDVGTFIDYDTGASGVEIDLFRTYAANESAYVVMGGETCAEFEPDDNCAAAGGRVDTDLALFHYSFLNQDWNYDVNDDWVAQGCMGEIIRSLGYRLQLVSSTCTDEARPGQTIDVGLTIRNLGYAAPYNRRGVELILRNSSTAAEYHANLTDQVDPRFWLPGPDQDVSSTLSLPPAIPTGTYHLFLHLPDVMPSLYGRTPYTVRLAIDRARTPGGADLGSVWEEATGYHDLRQTLIVNATANSPEPTGDEIPFLDQPVLRQPVAEIERLGGGMVRLTFRGVPEQAYAVEYADNLTRPILWTTLTTATAAASGQFVIVDTPGGATRYFRASRQ